MNYFTKSINFLFAVVFCILLTSCNNNEFDEVELKVNSVVKVDHDLKSNDKSITTNNSSSIEIKHQLNQDKNNEKSYENYSDISQEGLANVILDNGREEENEIKEKYRVNKNLVFRH